MRTIITSDNKRRYYFEARDLVKQVSTNKIYQIKEVKADTKEIVTMCGETIVLTTDIRPTTETLEKSRIVDRRETNVKDKIYFAKMRYDVVIPSKLEENGGYDIYANFDEDYMIIPPHTTVMIPTKLCSAFSSKYVAILKERGSTGTKGMGERAGVIDSGYRGEWIVPITNHNDVNIVISKFDMDIADGTIVYPYKKAICQAILVEVPKLEVVEISLDELMSIPSQRGDGKLGSSGK